MAAKTHRFNFRLAHDLILSREVMERNPFFSEDKSDVWAEIVETLNNIPVRNSRSAVRFRVYKVFYLVISAPLDQKERHLSSGQLGQLLRRRGFAKSREKWHGGAVWTTRAVPHRHPRPHDQRHRNQSQQKTRAVRKSSRSCSCEQAYSHRRGAGTQWGDFAGRG